MKYKYHKVTKEIFEWVVAKKFIFFFQSIIIILIVKRDYDILRIILLRNSTIDR